MWRLVSDTYPVSRSSSQHAPFSPSTPQPGTPDGSLPFNNLDPLTAKQMAALQATSIAKAGNRSAPGGVTSASYFGGLSTHQMPRSASDSSLGAEPTASHPFQQVPGSGPALIVTVFLLLLVVCAVADCAAASQHEPCSTSTTAANSSSTTQTKLSPWPRQCHAAARYAASATANRYPLSIHVRPFKLTVENPRRVRFRSGNCPSG